MRGRGCQNFRKFDHEVYGCPQDVIDDSRINVELLDSFPATKVSSYSSDSMSFQIIVNSAYEIYPNAHVTPGKPFKDTNRKIRKPSSYTSVVPKMVTAAEL